MGTEYLVKSSGTIPENLARRVSAIHAQAVIRCYGEVPDSPSSELLPEPNGEINGGKNRKGTPGCISTPTQPGTQIPGGLTQGSGAGGCCDAES